MKEFKPALRLQDGSREVFDPIRKRWVAFTPEEMIRQWVLHVLVNEKQVPSHRISVETTIEVKGLRRRMDIAVYDSSFRVLMVVECKAAGIPLSQKVFEQVLRYNLGVNALYVALCNGEQILCAKPDYQLGNHFFSDDFPEFDKLEKLSAEKS